MVRAKESSLDSQSGTVKQVSKEVVAIWFESGEKYAFGVHANNIHDLLTGVFHDSSSAEMNLIICVTLHGSGCGCTFDP